PGYWDCWGSDSGR
nr:hypothetical protein [Tanacetum cinerariifolium]